MASSTRTSKPLHPTNLHVNKSLFPNDTVQSKLPDPQWLEKWLDEQINFDSASEKMVIRTILNNLSSVFGVVIETVSDLNKYRKSLAPTPTV